MVHTIAFDLGGVILTIDQPQAVARFKALGLDDAEERLDAYTQRGIFGDLEHGLITAEDFRRELSLLVHRELSYEECEHAWRGYAKEVPQRNLDKLLQLKQEGYRVVLLSNTNPYMMSWAMSDRFDGRGNPLSHYLDACYLSYQLKMMKPELEIFRHLISKENIEPSKMLFVDDGPRNISAARQLGIRTFCPQNGADWTHDIDNYLK